MYLRRLSGYDPRRHDGDLDLNQRSVVAVDLAFGVGRLGVGSIFGEAAHGASQFRCLGRHREFDRSFASCLDVSDGLTDPIVKGIRLVKPWTVLLDSAPPDVLIGIKLKRMAPRVHRGLKITR